MGYGAYYKFKLNKNDKVKVIDTYLSYVDKLECFDNYYVCYESNNLNQTKIFFNDLIDNYIEPVYLTLEIKRINKNINNDLAKEYSKRFVSIYDKYKPKSLYLRFYSLPYEIIDRYIENLKNISYNIYPNSSEIGIYSSESNENKNNNSALNIRYNFFQNCFNKLKADYIIPINEGKIKIVNNGSESIFIPRKITGSLIVKGFGYDNLGNQFIDIKPESNNNNETFNLFLDLISEDILEIKDYGISITDEISKLFLLIKKENLDIGEINESFRISFDNKNVFNYLKENEFKGKISFSTSYNLSIDNKIYYGDLWLDINNSETEIRIYLHKNFIDNDKLSKALNIEVEYEDTY